MEHSYRDSTFRAIVEGRLVVLPGNYWVRVPSQKGIMCPAS